MSTRTKSSYQDPRYLQLWFVFDWPAPTDRVPVACEECGWRGRRCRRGAAGRPCPRCGGAIGTAAARPTRKAGTDNVVSLCAEKPGRRGARERRVPRMVSARRIEGR